MYFIHIRTIQEGKASAKISTINNFPARVGIWRNKIRSPVRIGIILVSQYFSFVLKLKKNPICTYRETDMQIDTNPLSTNTWIDGNYQNVYYDANELTASFERQRLY